jgi:hypothetical protein
MEYEYRRYNLRRTASEIPGGKQSDAVTVYE